MNSQLGDCSRSAFDCLRVIRAQFYVQNLQFCVRCDELVIVMLTCRTFCEHADISEMRLQSHTLVNVGTPSFKLIICKSDTAMKDH